MDLQEEVKKVKGFWDRPEGVTGRIAVIAALAGAGYGLYVGLPFIIKLLENTLYAGALAGAVFVLSSPLWSANVRTLGRYFFQSAMRAVTRFFVQIDPIGIIKSYVKDLEASLRTMNTQMDNLMGSIRHVKTIIEDQAQEQERSLRTLAVAKETGNKSAASVNARQASRLERSSAELQAMVTKMENLHKMLMKLFDISKTTILDMNNDVRVKENQHKAMKASYGAFRSALKVLNGDPASKGLYDQAMEHLAEDYASKMGEIESFMEMSEGLIASIDLDNLVLEKEAFEKLEARADSFLASPEEKARKVQVQESEVTSLFAAVRR